MKKDGKDVVAMVLSEFKETSVCNEHGHNWNCILCRGYPLSTGRAVGCVGVVSCFMIIVTQRAARGRPGNV